MTKIRVFRPAGATRCTDGGEIKFHPHRCNDKGVGPPKLKFLLGFDRNLEYKRPAGAYPLSDFHKICRVCTPFQDALGVKIWLDLPKGLLSFEGVGFPPNFQRPLAAKLCIRRRNVFQVKERARGPLSPCQVWWGSDFTRRRGGQKR